MEMIETTDAEYSPTVTPEVSTVFHIEAVNKSTAVNTANTIAAFDNISEQQNSSLK